MADEHKELSEETLEKVQETERFFSEPDPVEEGVETDGPTEEELVAMQDALDGETHGDSEELEQAEPEKKEGAELPETKTVEDAAKKPDLEEPPQKESEKTEISEPDSETEEQPAVADTEIFKPIKVTYVAKKQQKTREISSIQELQQLCSKADGLSTALSDTHTELQTVRKELEETHGRTQKVVEAYRRKEYLDKELEPFFDIFRDHPEMRQAFLNDPAWGPKLRGVGVKETAVSYSPQRAAQDYDLQSREQAVAEMEFSELRTAGITRFAAEYNPGGDGLVEIVQHAIDRGAFKNFASIPRDKKEDAFYSELERSYAALVRDGKVKTTAAQTEEEKRKAAEQSVEELQKISRDHRSAPGAGGTSQTPVKGKFEFREGEDTEDRNRRWLEGNPEAARELDRALS